MQSVCGYDSRARQTQSGRKRKRGREAAANAGASSSSPALEVPKEANRRAAYLYTGCLAHVDITYHSSPSCEEILGVKRIVGVLEHNEECRTAKLVRSPSIPLHEHVVEVAIRQLRNGAG